MLTDEHSALDHISIHQVLVRYCRGIDRLDRRLLKSVYWEDGYDNHASFSGKAGEFIDWVLKLLSHYTSTSHILGQSLIELLGDTANVETYFFAQHVGVGDMEHYIVTSTGRYVDNFEKRKGEWRILSRRVVIDFRRQRPFGPDLELPPSVDSRNIGRHGRDDFSYEVLSGD
jgi:SnoaL-like domain